jgi:hypothetical protein
LSEQRSGLAREPSGISHIAGVPLAEFGDTMRIEGVIVGDVHETLALYLPGELPVGFPKIHTYELTIDEAVTWLRQSDDPTSPIYTDEINKIVKAIVRKALRRVDQNVVWACYARDGYQCMYCGATGVPLTYDHFLAQAYGGLTTLENGVSACRPCNKRKGHMTIAAWIEYMKEKGYKYADKYQAKSS